MSKHIDLKPVLAVAVFAGLFGLGFSLSSKAVPTLLPLLMERFASGPVNLRSKQLTILGDTFSGYSTFRSPIFQQALEEVGIDLRYQDEFDQAHRASRLDSGQADLLVTTLDQFLKQKPQGKIVALVDRTVGADAVVLNTKKYPSLKSLLDLRQLIKQQQVDGQHKGQRLSTAFAGETPSEYLALVLDAKFEEFNLSDFQVMKVVDASEAWQLLQDPYQNVSVAVLWEPFVTQARQQGYTVVLSSRDVPNVIIDVIVASDRLLQSHPQTVSDLVEGYYRHIDVNSVRDNSLLQEQISEDGSLKSSEAATVLRGIQFFTGAEAKDWITAGTLKQRISSTAAVLVLAGQLNQVPRAPEQLFASQFITRAASNTQNLIDDVRGADPELAEQLSSQTKADTANQIASASQIRPASDIGNLQVRGKVNFARGSLQLTDPGKQTLSQLAQEIAEFNPGAIAVQVIGHTSQMGSASFNQSLSQKRAQAVVNYLRSRGLKHNFAAGGKGSSQPLSGISAADARNQRTEIRLVRVN